MTGGARNCIRERAARGPFCRETLSNARLPRSRSGTKRFGQRFRDSAHFAEEFKEQRDAKTGLSPPGQEFPRKASAAGAPDLVRGERCAIYGEHERKPWPVRRSQATVRNSFLPCIRADICCGRCLTISSRHAPGWKELHAALWQAKRHFLPRSAILPCRPKP